MPPVWEADITLTREDAARLVERQFPQLAPARLKPLGTGWDNAAYTVNGRWVFRFPRRKVAVGLLENESRLLPQLAAHLPLRIPEPVWLGRPEEDYPYPFAGYALLPGVTACAVTWTPEERLRNAATLGRFLAALHGIPVDDETLARGPGDELDRANLRKRAPMILERLAKLEADGAEVEGAAVRAWMSRLVDTPPWKRRACWVHGDLYARHLLVDEHHRVTGVLDWGDMHLGDPAIDLTIAFTFLPPEARGAFREAYGDIDEATWDRARFRAFHYGVALVLYGRSEGDEAITRVGHDALRYGATPSPSGRGPG
ncbi:phosphotransferase [Archangium violaceum]|uniref:phosphotransferase n=1 Tax=Archangium violaceum TaxID=83451 RepID=UPI00193BF05A|nr:phosphotransferase [Archangium violaceum]QRK10847.1 phosphotransferase [Archangium violaceum]